MAQRMHITLNPLTSMYGGLVRVVEQGGKIACNGCKLLTIVVYENGTLGLVARQQSTPREPILTYIVCRMTYGV
jgi:hypothetical protein